MAAVSLLCLWTEPSRADGSYFSYTPYSLYGIGDRTNVGTAYTRSMGGVGIAMRDNRFLNITNPASITARDSLAFMADFSLYGENKVFSQGKIKSASNTCNINDLAMSFPILKNTAMMIGIMPYSSMGYGYSYNETSPVTGNITYSSGGQGSLYQAFAAVGSTFFKRLSIGAQFIYYFGNLEKKYTQTFSDVSYSGYSGGYSMQLNAIGWKFGIQYEQPLSSKASLGFGLTHNLGTKLGGYIEDYSTAEIDTLYNTSSTVRLASETGLGISFKYNDKFAVEFDYIRSDWRNCGFAEVRGFEGNRKTGVFSPTLQNDFRFGLEYVPNRTDIRYYLKRCTYRAGAYFRNEYYSFDGNPVNALGITLGMTLPVFRWSNGLSLGVDLGQRGRKSDGMVRENYINFTVGMNIFDIWFQQPKYE